MIHGFGAASASPWPREKNQLLIISRTDYFNADLEPEITQTGEVVPSFKRLESYSYAEIGLNSKITVGGKIVYGTSWLTRPDRVETATGFSEVEVFGQHQVFRTDTHIGAVKIAAAIPSNFQSGVRPELQSDGADIEIAALYGRNLITDSYKLFTAAEVAYRKRISDSADQIRTQLTIGAEPNAKWLLLAEIFSTLSLRNEKNRGSDYDVIKLQPSVVWRGGRHWGLQAGVTEEVAGRNLTLGRTIFVGLWSSF